MNINLNNLYDASQEKIINDISKLEENLEYEDILLVISKEIISYRKQNNLTQKDIALKLGINQVMISKLESGEFNPTFKYIYKISKKLTGSSEIFLRILKSIIAKLERTNEGNYSVKKSKAIKN